MTLYVDIIFLENLFMNCIILLATEVILKGQIRIIRNVVASVIGSIYAIIIYTSKIQIYSNIFLKLILSIVIVYIAFKPLTIKSFFKYFIIFYLTSFTFGGVAFALLYFIKPQDILLKNGVLIGTYPIKIILSGGIIGFIIIITSFKNIKSKLNRKDMYCNLIVSNNDKKVNIKAIIDTGNFLKDPISKMPVIVVQKDSLANIFPSNILDNLSNIINGENNDFIEYSYRIRVIPFNSLGKENGLLLGIKMDEIQVEYQDVIHIIKNVVICIYNGVLSKNNRYSRSSGSRFT